MSNKPNLNTLTESQLNQEIALSIFAKINDAREMLNIPKLYSDTAGDKGIENLFLENSYNDDNRLDECLKNAGFVSKSKAVIRLSKQFKPANDNTAVHNNFIRIIEENSINKNMPLLDINNCFTHIGVYFRYEPSSHQYFIICVLSQKIACLEDAISVKDAFILQGQILHVNCFLYGVKVMKNEKVGYDIGPNVIKYNCASMKFFICLLKQEYKDLVMRKIWLYLLNSNECSVPYLNPNSTHLTVPWNKLELGLIQIVDFKKAKDLSSKHTLQSYLACEGMTNSTSASKSPNMLQPSTKQLAMQFNQPKPASSSSTNRRRASLIARLQNGKTSSSLVSTPVSKGNSFFNPNFRGISTPMMPIQEEPINPLNQSFLTTNQKNTLSPIQNIKQEPNNYFTLNNNNQSNSNNVADIIGNKLQKAEMLNNNIKTAAINTNPFSNSACYVPQLSNSVQNDVNMNPITNNVYTNGTLNNTSNFNGMNNNSNTIMASNANVVMTNPNQGNAFNNNATTNQQLNNNNCFINSNCSNNSNNAFNNVITQQQMNSFPANNGTYRGSNPNFTISQPQYPQNQQNSNSNQVNYHNPLGNYQPNISQLTQEQVNYIQQQQQRNAQSQYANANRTVQQLIKPITSVSSWQVIPNGIKFKNLLDVVGVGMNYVNNPQKYNFTKDPKYCINLSLFSSGNLQSYSVTPQTKNEFMLLLEKLLQRIPPNPEERKKFYTSNLPIVLNSFKKVNHPPHRQSPLKEPMDNQIIRNPPSSLSKTCIKFKNKKSLEGRPQFTTTNSNMYSIDQYIFKDSFWNHKKDKAQVNSKEVFLEDETRESLNEKILHNLTKKYLTPQEDSKVFNYNPSYEELYKTKNFSDVILTIKQEEIYAHKVVLFTQSPIFKEMIQKTDVKRSQQPELIKIVLPDSFSSPIFHEILKWIYCGSLKQEHTLGQLRDLLLMAENLRIYPLQKILIVKHIIPAMTKEAALLFLRDTYKKSTPNETCDVWNLLANFSINCIGKNSAVLLKTHRNVFLSMDIELLFKCVELSLCYLVEEIHLSSLIRLIIEKGFATDVFDLIMKISKKFATCRNYDSQLLSIKQFIVTMNRNEPFSVEYITEDSLKKKHSATSSNTSQSLDEIGININKANQSVMNSHFSFGFSSESKSKENIMQNQQVNEIANDLMDNFSSNSPKTNSVPDFDIKKNKVPTFEFTFQLEPSLFSSSIPTSKHPSNVAFSVQPITIWSECFSSNYRSWCMKIDISSIGEVSYYLVERGASMNQNCISTAYQLNYNSVLFDCSIRDISFEKNGVIFFSFINNQSQIIGYQNFFNLTQLGKRDKLSFSLWIKEFPLHSACLQHLSDNFQPLSIGKKGKCDLKEIYLNNAKDDKGKSFYDISPPDLNYILFSDALRVDNENTVMTAVYCYSLNKLPNQVDPLMSSIRFEFVDFKMLCTTARDHEVLKKSPQFRHCFTKELNNRIKRLSEPKRKDLAATITSRPKIKLLKGVKRYHYSLTDEALTQFNISNDLVSFFLDKGHHSGYIQELEKLKKLFEEEKATRDKREQELIRQNRDMKLELQRLNEIENKRKKYDSNQLATRVSTRGEDLMKQVSTNCVIF